MAQTSANVVAAQYEVMRNKIPDAMWEQDTTLLDLIKDRTDELDANFRSIRIPILLTPGGKPGYVDTDGGDFGRGSGHVYDYLAAAPATLKLAWEMNKAVELGTNAKTKAVQNIAARGMADATKQFRSFLDKQINAPTSGILGTIASGAGTTSVVLSSPYYDQLLIEGMDILSFQDSTLATVRNSGTAVTISSINRSTHTLTLSAAMSGGATSDVIVAVGLSSGSITPLYPLGYFHTDSSSGTLLGKTRSSFPKLYCNKVDAASNTVTSLQVRLAIDKICKARGMEEVTSLTPYMPLEQAAAIEQVGIGFLQILKQTGVQKFDPTMGGLRAGENLTLAGLKPVIGLNANTTQIHFLNFKHWGRAMVQDVDFLKLGNQDIIFPIYGSSGGVAAAWAFYLYCVMQIFCDDPGSDSYIDAAALPSGY